jgi:hypothetical protein
MVFSNKTFLPRRRNNSTEQKLRLLKELFKNYLNNIPPSIILNRNKSSDRMEYSIALNFTNEA